MSLGRRRGEGGRSRATALLPLLFLGIAAPMGAAAQERLPGDIWTETVKGSWTAYPYADESEARKYAPAIDAQSLAQDRGAELLGEQDAGVETERVSSGVLGLECIGGRPRQPCYRARRVAEVTFRMAGPLSVEEAAGRLDETATQARAEAVARVMDELLPTVERIITAYAEVQEVRTRLGTAAQGVLRGLAPLDVVQRFTDAANRAQRVGESLSRLENVTAGAVLSMEQVLQELEEPAGTMVGQRAYWYEMTSQLNSHAQFVENLAAGLEEAERELCQEGIRACPSDADAAGGARPDTASGTGAPRRPDWLGGGNRRPGAGSGAPAARTNADGTMPSADRALLILMDASGSMSSDNKMARAKSGAIAGIDRAGRGIWIMVASFSGSCGSTVRVHQNWTQDHAAARRAVNAISPGGGTPLAPALSWANRTIRSFAGEARRGGVILLADGQNDCGSVNQALAQMQGGVVFHNEAIGVGLEGEAVADMRRIAERTGGNFHNVRDASGIRQAFDDSFTNLYRFFTSWEEIIR